MNNLDDIEIIEKYLTKSMSRQEEIKIENRLYKDRSFRLLKEEMEILIGGIKRGAVGTTKEAKLKRLKDTYSDEDPGESANENENEPAKIRYLRFIQKSTVRKVASITTIVLLFGTITFFMIREEMQSGEKIYMSYLEHFESGYGSLRGDGDTENIRAHAFTAYENKNYQDAIPYFKEMLSENENDLDATLYLGICYMLTGDNQSAMPLLQRLASHPDYIYTEIPKYYLSLMYIKEEKYEQAKPLLEDVIEGNYESLRKNSQKILKKID